MNDNNPLVTFAMLTFNQESLVRYAIEGALAQDYSPLVIRISDDASSDRTYDVIQSICGQYRGPHKIIISRNEQNLGLSKHISKVNTQVEGEIVVLAAGDDVSMPSRVSRLIDCYLRGHKKSHYFCSSVQGINMHGAVLGEMQSPGHSAKDSLMLSGLCSFPISIGAAEAWSKKLIESFPPMLETVWAEDQVFGFRGRLLGPIGVVREPLVFYRHGAGITNKKRPFTLSKYFTNQVNGIRIYQQRAVDAQFLVRLDVALILWLKVAVLFVLMPLSPFLSVLRRNKFTQRLFKYL
jgi:glycosyltransferase involved in cell wall biosynthesis